jgi:hypothetical protein
LASDFGELGSIMSTFASNEKELTNALENIGSSLDNNFLSLRILVRYYIILYYAI